MEVGVSKFKLCHPFVKEGFHKYGQGFETRKTKKTRNI